MVTPSEYLLDPISDLRPFLGPLGVIDRVHARPVVLWITLSELFSRLTSLLNVLRVVFLTIIVAPLVVGTPGFRVLNAVFSPAVL